MREIWCVSEVWRALGEHVLDRFAAAAPATLVIDRLATRMIGVPLSGPKRQNSSEKGRARSTRGAGGRQALPTPWTIGAALAQAPDRSHRRPGAVLHRRTVDFLKRHDVEAPCAAMIKIKKMGMMPRLGAIQWCRLRRDLPSRSLAPAMGTKGGGKATAILNHLT